LPNYDSLYVFPAAHGSMNQMCEY